MGTINNILQQLKPSEAWSYYEELCANPKSVQELILTDILNKNALSEFGRKHEFSSIDSIESFTQKLPLSSWPDYLEYSKQMQNGASDVLFMGKPVSFFSICGT